MTAHRWYRLCVDLDMAGNAKGASFECRDDSGAYQTTVLAPGEIGPFQSPREVFAILHAFVQDAAGFQPALFPESD